MKKIIGLVMALVAAFTVMSQMQTVQLNKTKLQFDDGRDLPAEKSFIVTGEAPEGVAMVKMEISSVPFSKDKILYESQWRRQKGEGSAVVILPNHQKLKAGKGYHFRFSYFTPVSASARTQLKSMLEKTAQAMLRSHISRDHNKYKLSMSPAELHRSLNSILEDGMNNFETASGKSNPAFSEVIYNLLRSMARNRTEKDTAAMMPVDGWTVLVDQVNNEIDMVANQFLYEVYETILIPDYPVEKKSHVLAINAGYAGVYDGGSLSDLDYLSGPYAGISFPLGNRAYSGRFWNNLSVSAGIFLRDFRISDSVKATGPIVGKPIYAALGYRVLRYLKVHAGAAILEEKRKTNGDQSVYLKPFVGLSLEFNIWLGIDKN